MNILIVYGGKSCEHDISVITACLAKGYFKGNILSAYLDQDNVCYLVPNGFTPKQHKTVKLKKQIVFLLGKKQIGVVSGRRMCKTVKIDVAVNCCHGRCGEDGAVAALCELCNIPVVGSGVISSGITMDKIFTKRVLSSLKIPNVSGIGLNGGFTEKDLAEMEKWGYPIIVKPATLGSSIGISLCHNKTELKEGLEEAFGYDNRVLCEKALTNFYELNCSAMRTEQGVEISAVERPVTSHDILTFHDKYMRGEKFETVSEPVDEKTAKKVKSLTEKIYREFALEGVVRVDFLVEKETGKVYVNEINSIPGSLAYGLWQDRYSPQQFGAVLTAQAVADCEQRNERKHIFNSGVLDCKGIGKK